MFHPCVQWIRRYILFHNKRHPKEMGAIARKAVLTHLAIQEQTSAAPQQIPFSALQLVLFLTISARQS